MLSIIIHSKIAANSVCHIHIQTQYAAKRGESPPHFIINKKLRHLFDSPRVSIHATSLD